MVKGVDTSGIDQDVSDIFADLIRMRRHIHAHPEIGPEQPKTVEFVKMQFSGMENVATIESEPRAGLVVDIEGNGPGPTIAFRADMDALEVSRSTPVFSHNNCSALYKHPRNKTDEEIKKLAARGGVIGMSTVNFFVGPKEANTLDDLIGHFVHVAELVGIDHLAVGSDSSVGGWRATFKDKETFDAWAKPFNFHPSVDVRWPPFIEEVDVPEKMYVIADRLIERGFSTSDVRKIMGENWIRIYREVLG